MARIVKTYTLSRDIVGRIEHIAGLFNMPKSQAVELIVDLVQSSFTDDMIRQHHGHWVHTRTDGRADGNRWKFQENEEKIPKY